MKAVAWGMGAVAALAAGAALAVWLMVLKPLEQALAPAGPGDERQELLSGGAEAVVLMPFVTGDVPRLLRGEALTARKGDLWFIDPTSVGGVVGAVVLGAMGMPPSTEIGTSFRGGVAVRRFSCLTVSCVTWPEDTIGMWGMGGLRGMGAALGPEVVLDRESFTDHAAYLAAHAAVAADPLRWFAMPGAEAAAAGDSGMRLVVVALPSELVPAEGNPPKATDDAARAAELQALAEALLGDSGGIVEQVAATVALPIWVMKDGQLLRDENGTRALPGLALRNPVLRLQVPKASVDAVEARATALTPQSADLGAVDPALAAAFADWGLDGACLPGCAELHVDLHPRLELIRGGAPFWVLESWRVPAEDG